MNAAATHSAVESLPAELAEAATPGLIYQRQPIFSWKWQWQRTLTFMPLVIVAGVGMGAVHGEYAHDALQGFGVGWRALTAYLLLVGGGPMLATLVRQLPMRAGAQKLLLCAAIVCGFLIASAAGAWASAYHAELMALQSHKAVASVAVSHPSFSLLEESLGLARRLGIYIAVGGGWALAAFFNQQQRWREYLQRRELEAVRLEKTQLDARLSVLQAQIEPHFLFNTLASLRSLIQSDPQRAEATLDALADHLRATLPKLRGADGISASTLAAQLEICRSYLEVMRVRTGGRLSYSIDVAPGIAERAFPRLMLISLVENAVKHGAEPKMGACSIAIHAQAVGSAGESALTVSVIDDGVGLREGPSTGVGLANIRAQLAMLFGPRGSLDLRGGAEGGTIATITVPAETHTR